jgi:hypothetical protein
MSECYTVEFQIRDVRRPLIYSTPVYSDALLYYSMIKERHGTDFARLIDVDKSILKNWRSK